MGWLLLAHAAACLFWWRFTDWEIGVNANAIKANGSADTLHEGFHAQRTRVRLSAAIPPALLANLRLWAWGSWLQGAIGTAALLLLFGAYFVYAFNPALNVATGKPAYYVSADPHAAYFDRLLTRMGWGLRPVLLACLITGGLLYAAAVAGLLLLL